eukprot:SAG11_NODE_1494_length_4803_cov_1.551233_3_plen_82_part_00
MSLITDQATRIVESLLAPVQERLEGVAELAVGPDEQTAELSESLSAELSETRQRLEHVVRGLCWIFARVPTPTVLDNVHRA